MKTVVILTLKTGASGEALARLSAQETEAVWQGFATGCVRAAYGLLEGAGAVLEPETATAEEAARYVDSLPYVAQGLLDVRRCALKPFSGFAMLTK